MEWSCLRDLTFSYFGTVETDGQTNGHTTTTQAWHRVVKLFKSNENKSFFKGYGRLKFYLLTFVKYLLSYWEECKVYIVILLFVRLQQDGIYVNERFLHTFASCIVSSMIGYTDLGHVEWERTA